MERRIAVLVAVFLVGGALLVGSPSLAQLDVAQAPWEDWRTVELDRFRVHYPAESEAWALDVAGRLEAIRDRLETEIGYAPDTVVDVIVSDPIARPNGSAWPLLSGPRMILWTSPPGPESVIGHYRSWGELVALHEDAHLVHLLRPSRNPVWNALGRWTPLVGLGPVARRAPRWVTEGYATMLEGRLTGSGRPNGDLRATVLRQRALAGRLPSYGALASGDDTWLGGSMAYLAGSAFLEWLEANAPEGPDGRRRTLEDLWARMTARQDRSFEEAFAGTFGDSPAALYGRFTAEVTWQAVEARRRLSEGLSEVSGTSGEEGFSQGSEVSGTTLFQDLSWQTGPPSVSVDGSRLALVLRGREQPSELVVWETAPDAEAADKRAERLQEILDADPEDVAPVDTGPPALKSVARLPTVNGQAPSEPRFLPDGDSLLFVRFGPDGEGLAHPDLYRWTFGDGVGEGSGRVERLTRLADLRSPDPSPDGRWAVAVRHRHGLSQLVRVDLEGDVGAVTPWTAAEPGRAWAFPRVSPDGRTVAAVRHRGDSWKLVLLELGDDGVLAERAVMATPPEATVAYPSWSADGETLYASVGQGGFIDLWAFDGSTGGARPMTRTLGAALAPTAAPDAVYFLGLEADGLDLHRLPLGVSELSGTSVSELSGTSEERDFSRVSEVSGTSREVSGTFRDMAELDDLAPVVRPEPPADPPTFEPVAVGPGEPYGFGRLELAPLVNGVTAPSGNACELGVRSGDLLGRLNLLAAGSLGTDGAAQGGIVAGALRRWPVALHARVYYAELLPSDQDDAAPVARRYNAERTGLSVGLSWDRQLSAASHLDLSLDGHVGEIETPSPRTPGNLDTGLDTSAVTLRSGVAWAPSRGVWHLLVGGRALAQEGETDGDSWRRLGGTVRLGVGHDDSRLVASWSRHDADDVREPADLFQLGGVSRTVLPRDVDAFRIPVPALADATWAGTEHEGQRLELSLGGDGLLGLPLFWERHRVWNGVWNDGQDAPDDWLELAGIELSAELPPVPLVRLPATEVTAGGAVILDSPFEDQVDDVRFWVGVAFRP